MASTNAPAGGAGAGASTGVEERAGAGAGAGAEGVGGPSGWPTGTRLLTVDKYVVPKFANGSVTAAVNEATIAEAIEMSNVHGCVWLTGSGFEAADSKALYPETPVCVIATAGETVATFPTEVWVVDFQCIPAPDRPWAYNFINAAYGCADLPRNQSDWMPSSASGVDMVPCLVRRALLVKGDVLELWDPSAARSDVAAAAEQLMQSGRPAFSRLSGDTNVSYGDGELDAIMHPVWYADRLPVADDVRVDLSRRLQDLAALRGDVQPSGVVEDVVDPNLLPFKVPAPPTSLVRLWLTEAEADLKTVTATGCSDQLKAGLQGAIAHHTKVLGDREKPDSAAVALRVPTDFDIDTDGNVSIVGTIHQLAPRERFAELYAHIAQVFQAMLPAWEAVGVYRRRTATRLQVVFQAQQYRIKPGTSYSGQWHVEGMTENVVAAAVYYTHVDDHLNGGAVKFRCEKGPGEYYQEQVPFPVGDAEVKTRTGTAIVFSNFMPHRFRAIRNLSPEKDGIRTFMNFFVIDPVKRYTASGGQPHSLLDAAMCLTAASVRHTHRRMPQSAMKRVCHFVSGTFTPMADARTARHEVRTAMASDMHGFGYIVYGNAGSTLFVPSLSLVDSYTVEEMEAPTHTDSGADQHSVMGL